MTIFYNCLPTSDILIDLNIVGLR